jgi:hypothetical protein
MKRIHLTVPFLIVSLTGPGAVQTRKVAIDFDKTAGGEPVNVSVTGQLLANDYLKAFGITLTNVSEKTRVVVEDLRRTYEGGAIVAASGDNALAQVGSNDPVSFTMNFKSPLQTVQFTRPRLVAAETGITFPEWTAIALDENGRQLDSVGEPLGRGPAYYSDVPAKTFTLRGSAIRAIRFNSNNHQFAAFNAIIIDDLILN